MADAATKEAPPSEKPRFTARLRHARISARKMRMVVDLIRGKDYNAAIGILRTCSKRGAPFCKKLLESAVANAVDLSQDRKDFDANTLHIVEARVDGGPMIKRWRPSSARRPTMIRKRLCHVTLVLEEREVKESKSERGKRQRRERQMQEQAKKQAAKPAEKKEAAAPGKPAATPPPQAGSEPKGEKKE
ncbi:MAG: 50S ribosomal protein L22 [Planctomycetes bacterium]|nr:50S ribosomal protein L22 [Planctomycetota bacterium]